MVWSEQEGVSIVLPSDRVSGDGRNYIVIGEDVPDVIASEFSAALIFYSGTPDNGLFGFNWYAIGISKSGSLEIVGYFYKWSAAPEVGGTETLKRQSVLSVEEPVGVDSLPTLAIGSGTYSEAGLNVLGAGGGQWVDAMKNPTYNLAISTVAFSNIPGGSFSVVVPAGHTLEVEFKVPRMSIGPNSDGAIRLLINGNVYDAAEYSTGGGASMYTKGHLTGSFTAIGNDTAVTVTVQACVPGGTANIVASGGGYVWLRYMIR